MTLFGRLFGQNPGGAGSAAPAAGEHGDQRSAPLFASRCGWYGKLPVLGDFAARHLPTAQVECWDAWLAAGLGAWQRSNPGWQDAYLAAPSLRLLLGPGGWPGSADLGPAAGVLMPSLDRSGRLFPLTLLRPLGRWPLIDEEAQSVLRWLQAADELALDAIQYDWSPEQLDGALEQLDQQALDAGAVPADAALLAALGTRSSAWMRHGSSHVQTLDSPPPAAALAALFGSD